MAIIISGVAGFIGSNLLKFYLEKGESVIGIDNLCRGSVKNISDELSNANFHFIDQDINDLEKLEANISNFAKGQTIQSIWHLAANSDIFAGVNDPKIDLNDTFLTTFNLLAIAKKFNVQKFMFASSSAIYGDMIDIEIQETSGPTLPISNYGAMKLASEAIISAATETYISNAFIFRFPNVVGTPATHGVIFDFIDKLKKNNTELHVLGNGTQQKSYIYVSDLIEAMIYITENSGQKINLYNIGNIDEGVTVKQIAELVVKHVNPNAKIHFGEGNKGWPGDVPKFKYNVNKLKALGWLPSINSHQAIESTIINILKDEN